ncbi:MAG: GFA family protein [Anaerolineae bacterium]|nr:GFA family protein [Gloeobacterales cyanobacterium ES-bin-313]
MKYRGSCHCGKIAFEVVGEVIEAMSCNCSICLRKGSLLWFVPRDKLILITPEQDASTYMFNKHILKHRFCPNCGIHPFGEFSDPTGNEMAAVNIRCLEDFDLSSVPVKLFDGRSA